MSILHPFSMSICIQISMHPFSIYQSIHLPNYLYINWSVYSSIKLFIYQTINLSFDVSIKTTINSSIYASLYNLSIHIYNVNKYINLSIHFSIYPIIYVWILPWSIFLLPTLHLVLAFGLILIYPLFWFFLFL